MATTAVYSTSMEPQNPVADCAAGSNEHHHLSRDDPDGSRQVKQNVGDGELAGGLYGVSLKGAPKKPQTTGPLVVGVTFGPAWM